MVWFGSIYLNLSKAIQIPSCEERFVSLKMYNSVNFESLTVKFVDIRSVISYN